MAEGSLGSYVYCVLAGDATPALGDVRGVDPRHEVRAIGHLGMTALTSGVSLTEFGAEPLKRNLNDVQWLERTARAHQGVVDRALAAGTTVPLRLCTVCRDDAGVRELLEREHDMLAAAFERLAGRQEWGVKLVGDPGAIRDAARRRSSPPEEPADAPTAGRAHLARLRLDRVAREEAQRMAREAAQAVHHGLRAHAAAARVLRTPPRELSGESGALVLNGAYLVDRDRAAEFRALASELGERQRERGLRLEVTGPWPPYSFVGDPPGEREASRARPRR
jgi:Gas vesicle synthesis protein GvpL/GvpF